MRTRTCIKYEYLPVSPTPVCSNCEPYLFLLTFTCYVIILSIGSVKQVHCARRPQSRPIGYRLNCERDVARSGKTRNSHKILVGRSEGTTPLSKSRRCKILKKYDVLTVFVKLRTATTGGPSNVTLKLMKGVEFDYTRDMNSFSVTFPRCNWFATATFTAVTVIKFPHVSLNSSAPDFGERFRQLRMWRSYTPINQDLSRAPDIYGPNNVRPSHTSATSIHAVSRIPARGDAMHMGFLPIKCHGLRTITSYSTSLPHFYLEYYWQNPPTCFLSHETRRHQITRQWTS
jgi:hypothetical protein